MDILSELIVRKGIIPRFGNSLYERHFDERSYGVKRSLFMA